MLEKFGFKAVLFEIQATLSLMGEGQTTGLVFDAGDGVSHCIPIYEGIPLHDQIKRLNVAGRHVTEYLIKLLLVRGYAFNSSADFETVREIKEKLCYVAYDIDKDRKLSQETTVVDKEYKLPDGQNIIVGRERFMAPECLFNPLLIDVEQVGIPDMIYESVTESPMDCQKALANNIILTGGTTMFPGLSSRVENDLKETWVRRKFKGDRTGLNRVNIQVNDPPRRKHGVYMGASFLAGLAPPSSWVTAKDFREHGASILFQ